MIPILYESTEKNFTTNGLGRLRDAVSCNVIEERNGTYELDMVYPISGIHYDLIHNDRIIYAMPADGIDPQPFRIYKISKPISGQVTVYAEHISYLLAKAVAMPFTASSITEAISNLNSNVVGASGFQFWTDKSTTGTYVLEKPTEIRTILGGSSGSLLDTYGTGEYEFDKFVVKLYLHRGKDNGVTIRYGKNLVDLTHDADMTNVYTGIVPYSTSKDDDGNEVSITLPEKVVKSEHTGDYGYPLYKVVSFSAQNTTSESGTLSVVELRKLAEAYIKDNEGWEIADGLTVSFAALWQTDEYKDIAPLERVNLCDVVHVIYTDLGVNVTAKVTKTDFDVLNERYNSIELGNANNNLAKTISETVKDATDDVNAAINDFSGIMGGEIKKATNQITGGLGGTVVTVFDANGKPQELVILGDDTEDIDKATKVWRWNRNGLGYSSTGYNGEYGLAITKDGAIVADYITTGTLTANIIKLGVLASYSNPQNYWDMNSGTFVLRDDESNEGITYRDGVLDIDAGVIKTGILKDINGNVTWNLTTGEMTAKSLSIDSTNFKLTSKGDLTANNATLTGKVVIGSGYTITVSGNGIEFGYGGVSSAGFGSIEYDAAYGMKISSNGILLDTSVRITGALTLLSKLTLNNGLATNTVEVTNGMTVNGASKFYSNVNVVSGGITVTGASKITGELSVSQKLTASNGISVTSGGITVTSGGLSVNNGGISVTGNSTISGTLSTTGALSAGNGVTGNAYALGGTTKPTLVTGVSTNEVTVMTGVTAAQTFTKYSVVTSITTVGTVVTPKYTTIYASPSSSHPPTLTKSTSKVKGVSGVSTTNTNSFKTITATKGIVTAIS